MTRAMMWRHACARSAAVAERETFSAETSAVLERVGTVLGEREGTGPDDDPLLGAEPRGGSHQGSCGGPRRTGAGAVGGTRHRGLGPIPGVPGFAELPGHAIVEAASSCLSESDFRKRLLHR